MNLQKDRSPLPPPNLPASLLPVVPAASEVSGSAVSDRLYQVAALTTGAVLLATLL